MRFLLLLGLIGSISCDDFNDFYTLIEGDIVQVKPIPGIENSALVAPQFRWPNAELPYQISNSFSNLEKQIIRDALNEIQQKTCVRFRDTKNSDRARVLVVKKNGCYSHVGRQGSLQEISLGENCDLFMSKVGGYDETKKTILDRADRDEYVDIIWKNIPDDEIIRSNFKKREFEDLTLMDTPYSYSSIMHYHDTAFARINNGMKTIVAKKPTNNIGRSNRLTDIDADRIRKLYCPNKPASEPPTAIEGFNFQKGGGG